MQENKKDYALMSFEEFNNAVDEDSNLVPLTKSEHNEYWKDLNGGRYFYLESGSNDASEFYELEFIARLAYVDGTNMLCDDDSLLCMFGLYAHMILEVNDENMTVYTWFKRK